MEAKAVAKYVRIQEMRSENVETRGVRPAQTQAAEGRAAVPLLFLAIPAEMGYTVGE